ncbi:MAG TPA: hypothetical protein VLD67_04590, partial [Vicinamibacterales bacterium]|nr:hypothetical protein [Vicinamibacterales bacterium]
FAGVLELYDFAVDPGERRNLAPGEQLTPVMRKALEDYPVPSPDAPPGTRNLNVEERRSLASLGYVSATARPIVRKGALRPVPTLNAMGNGRSTSFAWSLAHHPRPLSIAH